MVSLPKDTALILIDVQQGFDDPSWGSRNNPQAEANIARLLGTWRETRRPVIHVQHLSLSSESPLGSPEGKPFKPEAQPQGDEPIFQKHVNSAFIGTDLENYLRQHNYQTLVIAGLTTDHCVSTTARMAGNLGFSPYLVADATATFDKIGFDGERYPAEEVHAVSLASLHGEFATVLETESILKGL